MCLISRQMINTKQSASHRTLSAQIHFFSEFRSNNVDDRSLDR